MQGAVERTHRRVRVQSSPDIFVGAVETGARELFDAQAGACMGPEPTGHLGTEVVQLWRAAISG
jgi:hypothetical protein